MIAHGKPRYSILIPTRNGIKYLSYAIESVLSQKYDNFELIVSDNHSTDGTSEYLSSIIDIRFRHVKPDNLLSMTEHFEFLISHALGDWITLIGDDDGLLPFFFDRLNKLDLDRRNIEAYVFERAYFFWEGCEDIYGDDVIIYAPARGSNIANNKYSILLCIMSIITYTEIPQLYTTGLVKRTLVERVKKLTSGKFHFGRAPDASSAVAIALHGSRHIYFNEPLFWVGSSSKSTGYAHSFEDQRWRDHEFSKLTRSDDTAKTESIPKQLLFMQDFAILFYEAMFVNPATSFIWKTRIVRNMFLAGLKVKRPDMFPAVVEAYGDRLYGWEISFFVPLVRFLKRRHEIQRSARRYYNLGIHSKDRARFPSLREASSVVIDLWKNDIPDA